MTATAPRQLTEKQFQAQVVELARLRGWKVYHTFDSRRSERGFPDLTLTRCDTTDCELLFVELKREGAKLTPPQTEWMSHLRGVALSACQKDGGRYWYPVRAYAWWPSDWDEIEKVLR